MQVLVSLALNFYFYLAGKAGRRELDRSKKLYLFFNPLPEVKIAIGAILIQIQFFHSSRQLFKAYLLLPLIKRTFARIRRSGVQTPSVAEGLPKAMPNSRL